MRYIPLPQILRIYWLIEKNMFSIEKNEILNPSWIGKALNKNFDYLMYYPSRRQMKKVQLQVCIQNNDFTWKKLNLCKF